MNIVDDVILPMIRRVEQERGADLPHEQTHRKAPPFNEGFFPMSATIEAERDTDQSAVERPRDCDEDI